MVDKSTIVVPDIGGAQEVDVIEVMVKVGDTISIDDSIVTLESEKASMEIPASVSGKVTKLLIKVGDKVEEGTPILELESSDSSSSLEDLPAAPEQPELQTKEKSTQAPTTVDISIPDIGGASEVDVIEIMVDEGQRVEQEQALLTLETDKATMDIPAPKTGKIIKKLVQVGDKVSQGTPIFTIEADSVSKGSSDLKKPTDTTEEVKAPEKTQPLASEGPAEPSASNASVHAGPSVRRLAHELGVALSKVTGSGRKGRITREDVAAYVKSRLQQDNADGFSLPKTPKIDFKKFGSIEIQKLHKIKRVTGVNVHRSWITIPHVTHFDEADITELELFRKSEKQQAEKKGYKLTVLAFITKAITQCLAEFPQFNASLDETGESLILKKYFNIGIAVDTPNGLVVPVIQNVDELSVSDIAREMARLSVKARDKGLMPSDMSGGCFTISSLGGIGGTAFTPIVNGPEVAILGLSRAAMKPVYINNAFEPRLMLPLSLSYDHRVIDGAEAARFSRYLVELLADIRRLLLGS